MASFRSSSTNAPVASLFFGIVVLYYSLSVGARPATFLEDFKVTWSDSHIRQIEGGRAIQLVLDQNSGNLCTHFCAWQGHTKQYDIGY